MLVDGCGVEGLYFLFLCTGQLSSAVSPLCFETTKMFFYAQIDKKKPPNYSMNHTFGIYDR
jgi:hypothetical protein